MKTELRRRITASSCPDARVKTAWAQRGPQDSRPRVERAAFFPSQNVLHRCFDIDAIVLAGQVSVAASSIGGESERDEGNLTLRCRGVGGAEEVRESACFPHRHGSAPCSFSKLGKAHMLGPSWPCPPRLKNTSGCTRSLHRTYRQVSSVGVANFLCLAHHVPPQGGYVPRLALDDEQTSEASDQSSSEGGIGFRHRVDTPDFAGCMASGRRLGICVPLLPVDVTARMALARTLLARASPQRRLHSQVVATGAALTAGAELYRRLAQSRRTVGGGVCRFRGSGSGAGGSPSRHRFRSRCSGVIALRGEALAGQFMICLVDWPPGVPSRACTCVLMPMRKRLNVCVCASVEM